MWYSRAWDMFWHWWMYGQYIGHLGDRMFSGREDGRGIVEEAVALVDGIRAMGSLSSNARFVFSVDLGGREVASISLRGDPLLYGHPVVSAVTLETSELCSELPTLPDLGSAKPVRKPVSLERIEAGEWQDRVERLQKLLYTYVDELPVLDEPLVPDGYFGPRYRFEGTPDSVYAALFCTATVRSAPLISRTTERIVRLPRQDRPSLIIFTGWASGSGSTRCSAAWTTGSSFTGSGRPASCRGLAKRGPAESASCCGRRWRSATTSSSVPTSIGWTTPCSRRRIRLTGTGSSADRGT